MSLSLQCLQDETFGPILMVTAVQGMDEAIREVNRRPKPLTLYLFTSSNSTQVP